MALDASTAQEMIRKLAEDRASYLDTLTRAHDVLEQALTAAAAGKPPPRLTTEIVQNNITGNNPDVESVQKDSAFSAEEESDTDDNESLFVQQTLPKESYEEEALRQHISQHPWTDPGRTILKDVLNNPQLFTQQCIFPVALGPVDDRSHITHYSIFDVGNDGAPLTIRDASDSRPCSRALAIWKNLRVSENSYPALFYSQYD